MKKDLQTLAVLGGSPAFERKLYVGRPNLGNREGFLRRVNDILDRRWLTNDGPFVREFEEAMAGRTGTRHFIAVCNGTIALELVIRALGLKGEVLVPSFTFIATAHALQWQEITPVFCDIDPATHNIDPARAEELITPRTTGIIGVHVWGRPCPVEALSALARRHRLRLMFDAAHALGCTHGGRPIGGFGEAEVFSFHATKYVNTFEGGGIATDSDDLAPKLRLMKNFGFSGYDDVSYLGTNGKMSEISAAMGLSQIESMDDLVAVNRRNYGEYRRGLAGLPGVGIIDYDAAEKSNFQYVVVEVDPRRAALTRDELMNVLWAENVLARRYFYPGCHRMEPYRTRQPDAGRHLAATEALCERVLVLPTGTAVSPDDIRTVCRVMGLALERGPDVRARLPRTP